MKTVADVFFRRLFWTIVNATVFSAVILALTNSLGNLLVAYFISKGWL